MIYNNTTTTTTTTITITITITTTTTNYNDNDNDNDTHAIIREAFQLDRETEYRLEEMLIQAPLAPQLGSRSALSARPIGVNII